MTTNEALHDAPLRTCISVCVRRAGHAFRMRTLSREPEVLMW